MMKRWIIALLSVLMFAACTKDGDTIYQPDPDEPKASTAPLVTVIYGKDALGDRSYNDLIYQGVEEAAAKYGLRTMQLSPTSYEEGRGYLQSMFQTVSQTLNDSVRRLFIVCAAGYRTATSSTAIPTPTCSTWRPPSRWPAEAPRSTCPITGPCTRLAPLGLP